MKAWPVIFVCLVGSVAAIPPMPPKVDAHPFAVVVPPGLTATIGWSNAPANSTVRIFTNGLLAATAPDSASSITLSNLDGNPDFGEYTITGTASNASGTVTAPSSVPWPPFPPSNHVVTFWLCASTSFGKPGVPISGTYVTLTNPPTTFVSVQQTNWSY